MARFTRVLILLVSALAVASVLRASLPQVATGQWIAGPDLTQARDGAANTLLSNGDALITGGRNSAGVLPTADVYHADGSLTAAANMVTARSRHSATVLQDGRVLVAGGDSGGGAATNAAEIYDPTVDVWTSAGTLSTARFGHTATLLADGRVAIVGGENNGVPVATIELYDPASNSFSQPAALNSARKDHAVALLADGRLLVTGGFGLDAQNNPVALNSAEIFDPAAGTVAAAASMNTARGRHSATAVLDGFVVVAGGSDGQADLNSIEIYTPATDTWALSAATLATGRSGHLAALLPKNNSVLISGGTSNGAALQSAEMYQKWTDAVVSGGSMNSPHVLGAGSAFSVDGLYLVAGGSGGQSTEFFRFATIATDKLDYSPGTPVLMTGTGYQPNETVVLQLKQDDGDPTTDTPVQADAAGNISYQGFAPDILDVGTHFHLTAIGQTSGFQAQTVFKDAKATATAITSSANPQTPNTAVTFTATVTAAGGDPTCGAVSFNFGDGSGPVSVNLTTTNSVTASHSYTATGNYTVTGNFNPGTGQCGNQFQASNGSLIQSIRLATTVSASSSLNPSSVGQSVTFTATVGGGSGTNRPTGSVTFKDGATTLGTGTLAPGGGPGSSSATFSTSALTAGSHTITAVYGGDAQFSSNSSAPLGQTVNAAQPTTLSAAAASGTYGGTATLSATLTVTSGGAAVSGKTISFSLNGTSVGSAITNASGVATLNNASLAGISAGTFATGVSASFSGDSSFTASSGTAQLTVNKASVTATVTANNKIYDGTTAATQNTCTLSGVLVADAANVACSAATLSFVDKNVGTGKTVTVSGISLSGTAAGNYQLSSTTGTASANITALALTVTAAANSKVYDGTTAAGATPTITSGALQGTDTASFSETYDTKHVGTGKTLTPSGTVNDGNSGNNYTYTFVNNTAGVITQRPITVTAATDTKTYDGTTSSTGIPSITSGSLASGDTAAFSQVFDSRNAGARTLTASGSVNDGNGGNDYAITFATAAGTINKRAITVTAVSDTKVYDGTTSSSATPVVGAPGIATGDTANFIQSFDNKNAGTGKTLTATGSVNDGNGGNNYLVSFASNNTGVITARPLTVTAVTNTKTYDGNVSAAALPTITSGALQGSDTATFNETYDNKNAGTGKTLTPAGTISDGNGGNNYAVTFTAVTTGVINQRALTVSATADNKIYDGTASATAHLADDRISGDVLTDAYASATFSDKNVGTGKAVTISGISISGADAGNYVLSSTTASATADITPRALTVSASGVNKIYDGTTAATVTLSDDRVPGDLLTDSYTTASFADKNVGTGKIVSVSGISVTGTDAGNYTFNTTATTLANITARPLTVAATGISRTYNGTTAAAVTLSDNRIAGDLLTDNFTSASFSDKNAGTGKTITVTGISISGPDAGNYSLASTAATTTADITPLPLTVTAVTDSKVYDGTISSAALPHVSALLASGDTGVFSQAFDTRNVGVGKILTPSASITDGNGGNNYAVTLVNNNTGTITARALTVSAASDSKVYDATTSSSQTPSITVGSIAPGDSGTFTQAFDSKNAGARTLIATGSITDGNGGNNYALTFVNAAGSIAQRPLTILASGNNKIYDGTTIATVTLTDNRLAGDSVTDSYVSAAFNDKNVGTGKPVSVNGLSITGPDAPNYIANSSASTTANIAPRALTVSASGVSKVYDGTPSATVTLSDDRVPGDLLTDNYTSASFADKNVGNGKTISVTGIAISGPDAGNYTANSSTSTTANITPLAIVGSITAANKVYDGTTAASINSRTLAGVLGSDAVSYTGGTATFADKNVGVAKAVTATGLFLSGADASNYTVNGTATATANITPLAITVTAAAETKVYGTSDPVLSYTSNPPLVGGDTFSGALTRVAGENVGSYSIQQGSLSAGSNYTMSFIGAQLTITKASSAAVILSSAPSVQLGQSVTFTATVSDASAGSSGTPTGNVQFYLDGALFGSPLALNASGAASISTSSLSASAGHTVYAVYLGDGNFFGSTSSTVIVATLYLPAGTACLGSPGHQILQPVNPDGTSTFKQGSTVPAKFRVCDINGNSIGTAGVVQSFVLVGVKTGTVIQTVDETVDSSTPDTAFRWDATNQQWIFNISTKTMSANSTYFFQIKLNDGSIISFSFGLPR